MDGDGGPRKGGGGGWEGGGRGGARCCNRLVYRRWSLPTEDRGGSVASARGWGWRAGGGGRWRGGGAGGGGGVTVAILPGVDTRN